MKKIILFTMVSLTLLQACSYKPIIDTAGRSGTFNEDKAKEITNDLQHCKYLAKENTNFINLCLNEVLSSEITLQPLKRFNLDAAIIFSDILMLPYGLGQKVEFEKNFGPKLGELNLYEIAKIDEIDFVEWIHHVYKAIKKVSSDVTLKNKNTIGFVGAPWTLLVYMINQQSPKKNLKKDFLKMNF